jgi:hypothetical protein
LVDLLFAHHGTRFEGRLPFAWPVYVEQSATFHHKPTHFPGNDQAWLEALNKGKAKEIVVGAEHPYPYGHGL